MFGLSGLSTQRVSANLPKLDHDCSLNATGAHSNTVDNWLGEIPNRMGQPYPVFKPKGGFECVHFDVN